MCEFHYVQKIDRRTWLTRSTSGLLAVWAGLNFGSGKQGWGVLLGGAPRTAAAQPADTGPFRVAETELEVGGMTFPVAAYVMVRGQEAAVIDTLTEGNAPRIASVVQSAGLSWDAVRHVILTHYHFDHAGSASDIAALAPRANFWAGAPDIPRLELSRPVSAAADGDEIFGMRVIATPGHTAGHISVLDPASSTVVMGDAAFNLGGQLMDLVPDFTENADQARESIRKLGRMNIQRALFGHGSPISQGASTALARLVPAAAPGAQPAPLPQPAASQPAPVQLPRR
jgi:glyoxylase-like metal-dependent hydrolase (beta-lactamase superfamily II)